ncbi:MAG: hypothetical protein Q7V01_16710 [Vicinamibacterales bacterium]|nr:hypothetical protein [Vicinamibacterales bacterium]
MKPQNPATGFSVQRIVALAVALAAAVSCGRPPVRVPAGPWTPDDRARAAFEDATRACRGIRTFSAEVAVAGRAAGGRVRGRLIAGFERPGRIRLEGVAPFGAPAFILAARDERAVLVLPRERRVLAGAQTRDVLEALAGLRRSGDDLLALLGGCVVSAPDSSGGSVNPSGWLSLDLGAGLSAFLRRDGGAWRLIRGLQRGDAASMPPWMVEYREFVSEFPSVVRLQEGAAGPAATDLELRVSQRDVNVAIPAAAFDLAVPAGYEPMSLDELRGRGPLADPAAVPRR